MKKVLLLLILFVTPIAFSQVKGINYQAVIYNSNGGIVPGVNNQTNPLVNKNICLQFTIIDAAYQIEYQEIVSTTTDEYGMVNLVIGFGNQSDGYATSFADVYWNVQQKSLKVGVDLNSYYCLNFVEISNQLFSSVPFALSAVNAENVTGVVSIENGGTNATTLNGALTNLGLENVDNTSDINKPISNFTQQALDLKEDLTNKSTNVAIDSGSDTKYPSVKAVKTYVDANSSVGSFALAEEVVRASNAEATIATNLNTEISRAVAAEATKEDLSNKSSNVIIDGNSDVKYPTVKSVKNYVDANLTSGSTALSQEIIRATTAENALTNSIASEATTRAAADAALTVNITNEVVRATTAEGTIANDLAAEVTRATTAEATKEVLLNKSNSVFVDGASDIKYPTVKSVKTFVDLSIAPVSSALTSEVTRATNAENAISTNITNEISARSSADSTLANNLTLEVTRATTAEGTLATNIANEVVRATAEEATKEILLNKSTSFAADASSDIKYPTVKSVKTYVDTMILSGSNGVAAEIIRATNAENLISNDLAIEATTRANADTALSASVTSEANTRAAADLALNNSVSTVTNGLASEITDRTNADLLKENLSNKSINVITDAASDDKYPSVKATKTYVDGAAGTNASAIAAEITRATNAEANLTANLDAEILRAISAETLKENAVNKSNDGTMASNSNVKFPTERAVRTYVSNNSTINAISSISANYTITMNDYTILCDNTSGPFTITLPNVVTSYGKIFVICKIDDSTNELSFNPPLRFSLNSSITTLNFTKTFKVQSDGASWFIIN